MTYYTYTFLSHHGILGQKWGHRNGPPYPLTGGDYSPSEKRKIYNERHRNKNSIYNKKHFDEKLKAGSTLSTLSYDKNRTKNVDMFYAVHDKVDAHLYNAFFNKPIPQPIYDEKGNNIGTGQFTKFKLENKAVKDIDIASEDSGAEAFKDLYSKNRDFYNYVTDPNRMRKMFVEDKYKFKGYRESRKSLEKIDRGEKPTEEDVKRIYRMFNYTIPAEGKDVTTQRAKFFNELSKRGYEAVLDTNDAIYGSFKARSPVIVFDQKSVSLNKIKNTSVKDIRFSRAYTIGRRALGLK